ncbi:outer membrane lipoprotein carrier protein LolA [Gilvimarinus sp. F26214L]|uniref:outer membrane lipoprotein carrier protein LolA n=1 Tax=Gilvimarinus sp. DZF01 TaxID=3461371 RepID=UPI004045D6ED
MSRIVVLSLAFLCALPGLAAESGPDLLAQLEGRIELSETVRGSFAQSKFIAVLPAPLKSSGAFSYEQGGTLVWDTREPIANRLVFDAQGIHQSVEGKTVWEVDGETPAATTITRVISSVLATDWDELQNFFVMEGEVNEQSWELYLQPKEAVLEQVIQSVTVRGDRQLESMVLMEANGDRSEITFAVQRSNEP